MGFKGLVIQNWIQLWLTIIMPELEYSRINNFEIESISVSSWKDVK